MSILTRSSNPATSLFETWAEIHPFQDRWKGCPTYQAEFSPWGSPEIRGTRFGWGNGLRMNIAWLAGGVGITFGKHYSYRWSLANYLTVFPDGRFTMRGIWGDESRRVLAGSTFLTVGYIASQPRWGASSNMQDVYISHELVDKCSQISQQTILNKYHAQILWELEEQEHGWGIVYAKDQTFPGPFNSYRQIPAEADIRAAIEMEEGRRLKRLERRANAGLRKPRLARSPADHTEVISQIVALLEPHKPANCAPHPKTRLKEATA